MRETADLDQSGAAPIFEERIIDHLGRLPPARPPLNFVVEDTGSGVRCTVVNDGPLGGRLNGAVRYDVYWAETVDISTAIGKAAGFARAVCLAPSIPATGVDHTQSSGTFDDPKYAAGYFYCCGVDSYGRRSKPTEPAQVLSGAADYTIPGDVAHLLISESGEVVNGTVYSTLAVVCSPPADTSNLGGVQLYLKDYLAIGDIQSGYFHRWLGHGRIGFKVQYPVPRRRSSIAVTLTNASANVTAASGLLAVAQVGDLFEFRGVRVAIDAVTDTAITLNSAWTKESVATTDYAIIATVRVFCVSVSKAGTRRVDIEDAPFVDVLMDGVLSAPVAPSIDAITSGNMIRLELSPPPGTDITEFNIYRGTGTAVAFADCVRKKTIKADPLNAGSLLMWEDTEFTHYEREQAQIFSYYATSVNTRGQESSPSTRDEAAAALDAPGDNSPTNPGRDNQRNLLWNAMCYQGSSGTAAVIDVADTDQDAKMGGASPPPGFFRWDREGDGISFACFENLTEILLPWNGAGTYEAAIQKHDAWDSTTGHIPKGALVTVQFKARTSGGAPDGAVRVDIGQYDDADALSGYAFVRTRLSNDTIDETATIYDIDPAEFEPDHRMYVAVFRLRGDLETAYIITRIYYQNGTGPANVNICEPMLSLGDGLCKWTAEIVDPDVYYGAPTPGTPDPPPGFDPDDGSGRGVLDLQVAP